MCVCVWTNLNTTASLGSGQEDGKRYAYVSVSARARACVRASIWMGLEYHPWIFCEFLFKRTRGARGKIWYRAADHLERPRERQRRWIYTGYGRYLLEKSIVKPGGRLSEMARLACSHIHFYIDIVSRAIASFNVLYLEFHISSNNYNYKYRFIFYTAIIAAAQIKRFLNNVYFILFLHHMCRRYI